MTRRAAAAVSAWGLALAALAAPAFAADAPVDLGAEFTRACLDPGASMQARGDALLQRGVDEVPSGEAGERARMFVLEGADSPTVFLIDPVSCTAASRAVKVEDTRGPFQAIVRAHAGGAATRLASYDALEPLDDGEYIDVYELRRGDATVRYTLMVTYNGKLPDTVFMTIDDAVVPLTSKSKRP